MNNTRENLISIYKKYNKYCASKNIAKKQNQFQQGDLEQKIKTNK